MLTREELAEDHGAIRGLMIEAFGRTEEAQLVDDLRADGDLAVSRVAILDGQICGHIALSPMRAPPGAMALAPLAVGSAYRRQGIGGRLVRDAIAAARSRRCPMLLVLGDPAYYSRFGFSAAAAAPLRSPYAGPFFMGLGLGRIEPDDAIYARAFDRLG